MMGAPGRPLVGVRGDGLASRRLGELERPAINRQRLLREPLRFQR